MSRSVVIHINGLVQGVGFRPFVYRLAQEFGVKGRIRNSAEGIVLEAESESHLLENFMQAVKSTPPPMSRIDSFELHEQNARGYDDFEIVSSVTEEKSAAVLPDIGICESCTAELNDPADRRYAYWAINCTDCGPRYSIIRTVPYDRVNTSMADFEMCHDCAKEYFDPVSRRYHAQPIGCHVCGPKLRLLDSKGREFKEEEDYIQQCANALKKGEIIAIKGVGGFHLMCNAIDADAVKRLREIKRREDKPFAVMFKDMAHIKENAVVRKEEQKWLLSKEKPIVLVDIKKDSVVSSRIAPGINRLGVFLPYTPLHLLLFKALKIPLAVTSANCSNAPIITDVKELFASFEGAVELVLDHDREIINAVDDSVMQIVNDQPMLLRPARGFTPLTLALQKKRSASILALGGNQKSTIALVFKDRLILSPYIGDLESIEACEYFERTLATFKRFYDFQPDIIMQDRHPEYFTSKWAKRQELTSEAVQHHYAHILACMAEYKMEGKVLGFSFDGTGYGDDGLIWGGEVMIADTKGYERIASLRPFRLLGGNQAVKEPRRIALSLLFECYTLEEILSMSNSTTQAFSQEEIMLLYKAWTQGINAPFCSSVGRIFDAVASLCGVVQKMTYEGESGLKSEALYDSSYTHEPYPFELLNAQIDWREMIKVIIAEEDKKRVVTRFYYTMVAIVDTLAGMHKALPVVLSGGVFQNSTLTQLLLKHFETQGRPCFVQQATAVNDGGVALGQAWYALHKE